MHDPLPPQAETYLRQLDRALWPLSSEERETILLELRGHLIGRAEQGAGRLEAALTALGSPAELARAFVDAGAGDTYRQVGMPGRALVPASATPGEGAGGGGRLRASDIAAQVRATWLGARNGMILVGALLVTTLTATNFLVWIDKLYPESSLVGWPIMAVRAVAALLALVAAYRLLLTEDEEPWSIDLSTLRFGGAMIAILVFATGGTLLGMAAARTMAAAAGASPAAAAAAQMGTGILLLAILSCAAFRVQPWAAAQAIGRRDIGLRLVWRGTRNRLWDIVRGWAMHVLPLFLIHIAIHYVALMVVPFGPGHLMLALLAAVAGTAAVFAAALLNATAFRWVTAEPIPDPRPFGTDRPSEELVEQARLRLKRLLEASPGASA